MPFPFLGAALAVGSYLTRPKGKRPNISGAITRFQNAGPNAGDYAFGERQLGRTNELIGQSLSEARAGTLRRFRARGLGGPAEDQALANTEQAGALARVGAGRDTADLIDRRAQGRASQIFNAEIGQARADQASHDAQQSGYWNSMIGLLPGLLGAGNPSPTGGPGTTVSGESWA
jgi:hypothetical protein